VYVQLLACFAYPTRVRKLKKALIGDKQPAKAFYENLVTELSNVGFLRSLTGSLMPFLMRYMPAYCDKQDAYHNRSRALWVEAASKHQHGW
jgi:hypothetical protein